MKKIISVFCALALMGSVAAFAQEKGNKKEDWREKVRSEQVALITSELDLTEAEAQAFWPVYNEVQAQRREAFQATSMALKALKKGEEGKDVNALLDQYEAARKNCNDVDIRSLSVRVSSSRRSAKVDFPWSICAMMQKLRIFFIVCKDNAICGICLFLWHGLCNIRTANSSFSWKTCSRNSTKSSTSTAKNCTGMSAGWWAATRMPTTCSRKSS